MLIGVAAAGLVFWMQMPRPDSSFEVLGVSQEVAPQAGPVLTGGLSIQVVRLATNAEVPAEGTAPVQGRYAMSTWTSDEDGQTRTRRIRFAPGPYHGVDVDLVGRRILDGFGRPAFSYSLKLEGALSADGTEYAFYLLPTAHGRGDATTVACALDYDEAPRLLTLTIDEFVAGETRRFTLGFDVAEDATITQNR